MAIERFMKFLEYSVEYYKGMKTISRLTPYNLILKEAKAIVSVCEADHHSLWANILPKDGCMKDFIRPETMNKNRQELPIFYRLNGSIYFAYCNYIKQCKSFIGKETFAYIMPKSRSVDIDNEIDLNLVEVLMKN